MHALTMEDVVDEVEHELDGGAERGQRSGEREEEDLQEEVEEDGEAAREAADLGAGEAVDGPVPANLGREEEMQELHGAGPVRAQHHVVIAEAVVELAHALQCTGGCDHDVSLWQRAGKCTCGGQRGVVYVIVRRGRATGTDQKKIYV